jgi:hypothetical protein
MNDSASSNTVLKCKITVKKTETGYSATYVPEIIPVFENNTDVHFHIDAKSSDAVEIDSVTFKPDGQTQLVDQEISTNRQQLKLKDLNTEKGTFILSFTYKDQHGMKFAATLARADCETSDFEVPQIENNPP